MATDWFLTVLQLFAAAVMLFDFVIAVIVEYPIANGENVVHKFGGRE